MFFIVLSSIYLGLLQLELFASFLFISEFVILIFFFSFFFKLNINNKLSFFKKIKFLSLMLVVIVSSILTALMLYFFISYNIANDCYLAFYNFYKIYNYFLLNDFSFFFYSFFQFYLVLYLLIGIFLLVMTAYLLYIIWVYVFLKSVKTYYKNDLVLSDKTSKE